MCVATYPKAEAEERPEMLKSTDEQPLVLQRASSFLEVGYLPGGNLLPWMLVCEARLSMLSLHP